MCGLKLGKYKYLVWCVWPVAYLPIPNSMADNAFEVLCRLLLDACSFASYCKNIYRIRMTYGNNNEHYFEFHSFLKMLWTLKKGYALNQIYKLL